VISDMTPWFGEDRVLSALEAALSTSLAGQVEISATSRVAHHTRFAGDRIHQAQSITECQIMVRAVVGTGSARVAVNSLDQVRRAVDRAGDLAKARDGIVGAARPYDVADGVVVRDQAGLWYDSSEHWDVGARSRQAGAVMAEARIAGGTVNGTLHSAVTELAVVTTRGTGRYACATEAGFTMTVRCGDASSYIGDLGRDVSTLEVERRALEAIASTSRVREIVPVPDGVHDVVFGGLAAGELIGFVPDFGFTVPAYRAGIGLVAQRPGEQIAPESVTIADDARSAVGLPFPFDFEASPKRRVDLVLNGRVGAAVSDRASAFESGGVSTGHASIGREQSPEPACANLVMAEGTESEEDLIGGVERGLYVQRLWYNRLVDVETGTVVGTSRDACFLIEDGQRTKGLAGGRFNESVISAIGRIDGIGRQRITQPIPNIWNSCITAPAIRVRGFRFGTRSRDEESS
jgi:predicted Zn-dependent protease